jgi:hypothetical protein
MVRRIARFVVAAALVASPALVQAQTVCAQQDACSLNPTATLTIPTLVRMSIPSADITLDGSAITDISGGAAVVPGAFGNVNVRANADWNLTLGAAAATWTYTGTEAGVRGRATLEYSVNSGAFTPMTAGAQIATGTASNGDDVAVAFQATVPSDYSDPANRPGSYALTLTFTLTAP